MRFLGNCVLLSALLLVRCGPPPGAGSADTLNSATGEATQSAESRMNSAALESYQAGVAAFQRGDLPGARAQFELALSADPRAVDAHHALGAVRERLGAKAAALTSYQAALARAPGYEPAIASQTQLLLELGRAEEAERSLMALRARLPESAGVLTALAEVKSRANQSAEAQALAQAALKRNPDYRPAMVLLARDHLRARRWELALFTLTAILDGYGAENPPRDPNNSEAHLLRGLILKEQNRRRPAVDAFKKALEYRPDLIEARLNLGALLLEAGNAGDAVTVLEQGLAFDAANTLLHLNLGDAYRLLGRPDEAIRQLDWVIQADRSLAQAHYNLGLVYLLSPSVPGVPPKLAVARAIEHFEQYKTMRPRARSGDPNDVEELLARARNKKAIVEATIEAPAEAQTPATPAAAGAVQSSP